MIVPSALAVLVLVGGYGIFPAAGAEPAANLDGEVPPNVSCDPVADFEALADAGISPPVVVTTAEPVYPEGLRKARVDGEVEFSAVICTDGVPRRFELESEKPEGFRGAALQAASRWRYRPAQRDGVPVAVKYAIRVAFRIHGRPAEKVETWARPYPNEAAIPDANVSMPTLRKRVEPRYPAEHRLRGDRGRVVLLARIESDGTVGAMKTLDATSYTFERAAREAVKQWVYDPARRGGEPVALDFTVAVDFNLQGPVPTAAAGKVTPPELLHDVPPVFPPELLAARRTGSVTVELFVTRSGAVEKFEILGATHPAFADAVRAAVPQWKFAPGRLDGVPTATSLKLTIPFEPPPAEEEGTENR